jgi:hypothetical protein
MRVVVLTFAALLLLGGAHVQAGGFGGELGCSKFKDEGAPKGSQNLVVGGVACVVKLPAKQVCSRSLANPGARGISFEERFFCYKVKCPKAETTVSGMDIIGSHAGPAKQASVVCLPELVF